MRKISVPTLLFYVILILYLLVCIYFADAEKGGGLINQISAGLLIVLCTLRAFFFRKEINPKGRFVYRVILVFYIYLLVRLLFMLMDDPQLALSSVRDEITIIFWASGLLFCVQEFYNEPLHKINNLSIIIVVLSFIVFINNIVIERNYFNSIEKIGAVNDAGSAYMLVPLIALVMKGKMKFFWYLLCLVICAWSQKRQALLGFATISIFILFDLIKYYFKNFKFTGIILILIVILFSGVIVNGVFSGIMERQQYLNERDDSDSGRYFIWKSALEGFSEAPTINKVFGGGPGAGGRYVEERSGGWFVMPHNAFIEVMCDYGLIGLTIFLLFFFLLVKMAFNFPRESIQRKLLYCIIITWLVTNMVSHAGRIWLIYFSIAIGIILNSEADSEKVSHF